MRELDPFGMYFFASSKSFALFLNFGTSRAIGIGKGSTSASEEGASGVASFAASLADSLADSFGDSFRFSSLGSPAAGAGEDGGDGADGGGAAEPSAFNRPRSERPPFPPSVKGCPSRVGLGDGGAGCSSAIKNTFWAVAPPRTGYI